MSINRLVLDNEQRSLAVEFSTASESGQLSYEYLRISSETIANKKQKKWSRVYRES
jgi:hypothetical protein